MKRFLFFLILMASSSLSLLVGEELLLRNNLQRAERGEFLVAAQNKTYSLLHIYEKRAEHLLIEEIIIPMNKLPRKFNGWKEWVKNGALGNSSWMLYSIDVTSGKVGYCYSVTKRAWQDSQQQGRFITTLLNIPFRSIPEAQRRRIGLLPTSSDGRALWQPKMVAEGQHIPGVIFDGWTAHWPRDSSELSGKSIEVYLPREQQRFPSYFPYWFQVSNGVGRVSLRIVDSGSQMQSPINFSFPGN